MPLKLKHKTPCNECPWRLSSLPGYLGGNTPETYADMVQCNTAPPCHTKDGAFCVGGLAVLNNSCTAPRYPAGAADAAEIIGERGDCFKWVRDFYRHHSGKDYVHPIERAMRDGKL